MGGARRATLTARSFGNPSTYAPEKAEPAEQLAGPTRRDRVAKQHGGRIPSELLRHDPRPDHSRDEQCRSKALGDQLARERHLQASGPQDFRSFA